jgi:hypothetical protein
MAAGAAPVCPVPACLPPSPARRAANAWAVGYAVAGGSDRNVIWHWNGSSWHRVPSPRRGDFDNLDGVAATSATSAWAVGTAAISGNVQHALILRCH